MKNTNRLIDSYSTLFLLFLFILLLNGCAPKTIINASYDGDLTLAKELIRDGADVNTRYSGLTPLHNAAHQNHLEVAKLLIEEGANINSLTDRDGITPLANAAANGHLDMVKLLVENGAKINFTAKGKTGVQPLHNAANYGHLDIAKFLIQHGADVNAVTYTFGITPLHNAAANGYIEIVQVLIENGADMNVKAIGKHKGKTPLDNAIINRHEKVANLLISQGANKNSSLQTKNEGNNPKSKSRKLAKKAVNYPNPVHMSSNKYMSLDQLYLGKRLSSDNIALIGTFTWLDGNNKLSLKELHNVATGKKWVIQSGTSGFHDFLEIQAGTYKVVMLNPHSKQNIMKNIIVAPGETYALYSNEIKPVGNSITQKILSKSDASRYILLPFEKNLENSRSFLVLCGLNINDSSVSISIQEFKNFYVGHSTRKDIEWGIGKASSTQIVNQDIIYEYPAQIYKTELDERRGMSVHSNSKSRTLKLVFDKMDILKKIIEI